MGPIRVASPPGKSRGSQPSSPRTTRAEVGRRVRKPVAARAADLPEGAQVFVHLHPDELRDGAHFDPGPLSRIAARVVFELPSSHAAAPELPARARELRRLGCRIAVGALEARGRLERGASWGRGSGGSRPA